MKLLTLNQAAEVLQVHPNTVRAWCQAGKLRASKPGRAWRIRATELDRLLQEPVPTARRLAPAPVPAIARPGDQEIVLPTWAEMCAGRKAGAR